MSDIKPLGDGDLRFNQNLAIKRGSGGEYDAEGRAVRGSIQEEVVPWGQITKFTESDVTAGLTQDDVAEIVGGNFHLGALFGTNPREVQASAEEDAQSHEISMEHSAQRFVDPAHYAGTKRIGMLVDANSGESIRYKRLVSTKQVELSDEKTGELIEVLSAMEFENLIRNSDFQVL